MKYSFDDTFFATTRGRIVLLLREKGRTVGELAVSVRISDNAVRGHLLSLERDRLVQSAGTVQGFRKPHALYELTEEARRSFPRPYGSILKQFLSVLKRRISRAELEDDLKETGRQMADDIAIKPEKDPLEICVATLLELGGSARVVRDGDAEEIRSDSCPFGELVAEHPEICGLAESMVSEIVDRPVKEQCDRRSISPKCRFLIAASA